ncbi:MAG: MBL fold metallo-hydrolase [Gemmatimonadota bacterium]
MIPPRAFSLTTERTRYPLHRLAAGVYAIAGDTGKGAEGRPNAGFVDSKEGVVVIGGLASPAQGRAVIRTLRSVTQSPIRWLVLYAHHPDMQFGASALRDAGARVIAHPDTHVLAAESGPDAMVADWDRVVGLQEMIGFRFADTPDRPVTGSDTLRLGGREIVIFHPGDAHSPGDLMVWLPGERVLFAGDILVADGVPMIVDGSSPAMLHALALIDSLHPAVIVPGHGAIARDPDALVAETRRYFEELRESMRGEVADGHSMTKALASLPPADAGQPVTLNSRRRRNAVRVYLEMEKAALGLD